ncbi:MAG: LysM peptidoglycan-binding domain-containing protein [Candidatus Omnitrophica bacterium]|nr:LysM peptidoglycan-binding domain-containing protein [Candidatus Omnitrophota bacterium]
MVQAEIELPTLGEVTPWRIHRRAAPSSTASAQPAPAAPSVGPEELPAPEEEWEAEEPRREETPGATPYTVKKGDTLEKIAEKFYGDAGEWRRIYNANRDVLKSPNRIYPGQKLQIPAGESRRTGRESPSSDLK